MSVYSPHISGFDRWCVGLLTLLGAIGCTDYEPLVWNEEIGYQWADFRVASSDQNGFESLAAAATGITFVNALRDEAFITNRHLVNGSGVALGDVDGDGWIDVYFAGIDGANVLYRNAGGWRFEDITERAGVTAADRHSTGAVFADIDADGDLDLLLSAMGGPNTIFLNDGAARFTERPLEAGAPSYGSTTMALADIDGDSDLDLYVGNYKKHTVKDLYPAPVRSFEATVLQMGEEYVVRPEFEAHYRLSIEGNRLVRFEYAEPDFFYLNDGKGQFTSVSFVSGRFLDESGDPLETPPEEWALVPRFQDVNGDGAPDLYLCNDFESPDRFWINRGDGKFRAVEPLALRKTSGSSMSVAFADINRDEDVDFFVADMLYPEYPARQVQLGMQAPVPSDIGEIENRPQIMQNMLMLNRGDGTYADIANMSGVQASGWTWSSRFLDVDLDGYEDLLLSTGHRYDAMDTDVQMRVRQTPVNREWRNSLLMFPDLDQYNMAFRNVDGVTFSVVPQGWGLGLERDVAHGMAFADLDNDGDLDVVMNRLNRVAGVFRNVGSAPRVAVRLRGANGNTQGIGAKIRFLGGAVPVQTQEVFSGGEYLSGSDPMYSFATGDNEELSIEVVWRSGKVGRIDGVKPNRVYEIFEGGVGDE